MRDACGNAVILRPSVLFGPDDAFIRMLAAVTRLPLVPLFGRSETRLQPVHVGDVAVAVLRAVDDPAAAGRIFELGGAGIYRYCDILRTVPQRRHLDSATAKSLGVILSPANPAAPGPTTLS